MCVCVYIHILLCYTLARRTLCRNDYEKHASLTRGIFSPLSLYFSLSHLGRNREPITLVQLYSILDGPVLWTSGVRSLELWLYNSNVFTFFRRKNTIGVVGGYLPLDGTMVSWRIYFILYLFIFILPFRKKYPCTGSPSLRPPSGPRRHAVQCDESHRLCRRSDKANGCRKRR